MEEIDLNLEMKIAQKLLDHLNTCSLRDMLTAYIAIFGEDELSKDFIKQMEG